MQADITTTAPQARLVQPADTELPAPPARRPAKAAVPGECLAHPVFMNRLQKSGGTLSRKAPAERAITDAKAFGSLLTLAKTATGK